MKFWATIFIVSFFATAASAQELLRPSRISYYDPGVRGEDYTRCMDGDLASWWKPELEILKVKPVLQLFFDKRVTISTMEIAQGYPQGFLYKASYRIKEITIRYADGMSQKVRIKDTAQLTSYKLKSNEASFIEIEFSNFYPGDEGWYFLLRELKLYGKTSGPSVPREDVRLSFVEYDEAMDRIFDEREKFQDEFPYFGQYVEWPARILKLEAPNPEAGYEVHQINPTLYGGDLDEDGLLNEEYIACMFFDNPGRSRYAMYDGEVRLRDRLEWSKAKYCYENDIPFTVRGRLLKPLRPDNLILDDGAIVSPALPLVKEEPIPVAPSVYRYEILYDWVEPMHTSLDTLFYIYIQDRMETDTGKSTRKLYANLGRPGFVHGEWQTPSKPVKDVWRFVVESTIRVASSLKESRIYCDEVAIGYKFKYYTVPAVTAEKMLQMQSAGEGYDEILSVYKRALRLD